ncbi:DUF2017 domain-containing protein [Georgenia alba]|uniref:DUF2017 domain-containing protein n=1 Tax=Georgenia alba TaxID=2233858 RepID=A0ABW2Q9J7_9MICO
MHAFVPAHGGLTSRLETVERRIIARLVADTAELLGTRIEGRDARGADVEDVLAALDFEPSDGAPGTPTDAALARLLPPMSEDEDLAGELRSLTEDSLRAGKVERLETVWRALTAPGEAVVVAAGTEGRWLAALTDVRLVLAARLGIEDESDAEAVYRRAERPASEQQGGRADDVEEAMATMYAALTWWQESLLQAMSRRGRGR